MNPHEFSLLDALRDEAEVVDATLPARSRGVVALLEENCTVCMLCVRECPVWCIEIDAHDEPLPPTSSHGRPRSRHVLDRFAVDYALCMYCGICVEVCPFDALFWAPAHDYAGDVLGALTHEKERLGEWLQDVPAPPPLDPGAAPTAEQTAAERR